MHPQDDGRHSPPDGDPSAPDSALFKAAIEAIGDAVVVTGPELELPGPAIQYVNPAFCRMTGYTASELIGQTPRLFQGPLTDRAELDRLRPSLAATGRFQGEVVNYRKDGQPHVIEWLVTPIKNEDGAVIRWLSVQRDITHRKQLERQQELMVAELQHRTRNLLSVVSAIASRTLTRSAQQNVFEDRLAALSRVQTLLASRSTWSVTLSDLIDAELQAAGALGSARITSSGPRVEFPGDKVQPLAQVLHELVTNATRHGAFSQPAGQLKIRWDVGPDGCLTLVWRESAVTLADHAPGMGFGRDLIERSLRYQLRADTRFEFQPDGIVCTITLPSDAFR